MCKQISTKTDSENRRWQRRCLKCLRSMNQRQQQSSFKKIQNYFQYPTLPRCWNDSQVF